MPASRTCVLTQTAALCRPSLWFPSGITALVTGLASVILSLGVFAPTLGCRPAGRAGDRVNVIGSTTVLPIAQAAAEDFNREHPGVEVLVQGGGSSAGIEAVATGRAEIGTSSRDLKDEEKALGLTDVPVAIDVIAVIVNPANPVTSLSLAQLRDIFMGKIINWSQVGGFDEQISLVNRDEASGTREAFWKMVLDKAAFAPNAAVLPGTGQVRAVVATSRDAIGYISVGYVTREVKTVSLDGVAPTIENVKLRRYRLRRTLHFFVKGTPTRTPEEFIDYVLSPKIQADVVGKEFIPIEAVKD